MTHMTAGRGLSLTSLSGDHLYGKSLLNLLSLLTSLMVSFSRCLFSHEMSWMRSWTELSQFLRLFLSTLIHLEIIASGLPVIQEIQLVCYPCILSFSFVKAAVAWATLGKIWYFEPSSDVFFCDY